ncbi:MAG: DNA repair protein RecO [Luteimonas sp.]
MRYLAQPAYVLHARAWRETSLLLEVLTADYGRLGLVARGVRGPKRQVLKAALQPLQHIRFDAVQRGELAQLVNAEAIDAAPRLRDEAMLAGLYVSELLMRLAPRQDPQSELYAIYGQLRDRLRAVAPLAWTLRRFERDLLDALGVGFDLQHDGDGAAIDPAARYRLDPEHGPRRLLSERGAGGDRDHTVSGRALLALAADRAPDADELPGLRRALRPVLAFHLGGRGLKSWELMAELGRIAASPQGGDSTS